MIVSWDWLQDYLPGLSTPDDVAERLTMAGLNLESVQPLGTDYAIDLEVTSNRADCLGHLGIAREIAVLFGLQLKLPRADVSESGPAAADSVQVELLDGQLCPRYLAAVIRGVKVGPSPAWLVARLKTLGLNSVNNVVDVTNYVLMETGQPLHAFDLARLQGKRLIIRAATPGEPFVAINHKPYTLESGMCVIADALRPVALAGVMGGVDTEVSASTRDVVLEIAEFSSVSVRNTARKLNLRSDSSYRFERGIDRAAMPWVLRRAATLLIELAGGALAPDSWELGQGPVKPAPIRFRPARLKQVLGIDVPHAAARTILQALGCQLAGPSAADGAEESYLPPTWRKDLTREIDLVEEVARVHGYDKIPENASVPIVPSRKTSWERLLGHCRHALTAAGFDEAMTVSAVTPEWSDAFSPWSNLPPLVSGMPILRGATHLRRSLLPSLLGARRINESLANPRIELFETARVYLPRQDQLLPQEETMLGLTSGDDFFHIKGMIEALLARLPALAQLIVKPFSHPFFQPGSGAELRLAGDTAGQVFGYLGSVSAAVKKQFELRGKTVVAELKLSLLAATFDKIPQCQTISPYPCVSRDINLVLQEQVTWAELAACVEAAAGPQLEKLAFVDIFRDAQKLGSGKKSCLFTVDFRSSSATLTSAEVDSFRDQIVAHCAQALGAQLRVQ